jgi:hypothetical protein
MQPTRGSAVPKFGDWDSNPASADGYTHIFNKVREEKQTQAGKPAAYGKDGARGNGAKQHHDDGYVSSVSGAQPCADNTTKLACSVISFELCIWVLVAEILVLWMVQVEIECLMNGDDDGYIQMLVPLGCKSGQGGGCDSAWTETISMIFFLVVAFTSIFEVRHRFGVMVE